MDGKAYWDEFYEQNPFYYGKGPSAFLEKMMPRLRYGKVLDIGMGEGANAVYLASKGYDVVGFDLSSQAINQALAFAKESNVKIAAKAADLDLYLMGVLEYDVAIMSKFRPPNPRYYSAIISALKQGGTLLIDSYGIPQMNEPIGKNEQFKNFYYNSNEIFPYLKDLKILFYQEGLENGVHVVQCLAEKPIDKHALKHDVFGMHSKGGNSEATGNKHLEMAESFFKK